MKPNKEQIERIARALYPVIFEYYYIQDEKETVKRIRKCKD